MGWRRPVAGKEMKGWAGGVSGGYQGRERGWGHEGQAAPI